MKKIFFFLFFALFHFTGVFGQIQPYLGIYPVDEMTFENTPQYLKINPPLLSPWQIGSPDKSFFGTAHSPSYAIMTDTLNPYPDNTDSYFDLIIPYNMYFNPGPVVSFYHKLECDTLTEGAYIEISYDMGASWTNVVYDTTCLSGLNCTNWGFCPPNTEEMYHAEDTINGGIPAFTGTIGNWKYSRIQWIYTLPVLKMPYDTTLLRFHFRSDNNATSKAGWIIDNISLEYTHLGSWIPESGKTEVNVYPNPAVDVINIESKGSEEFTSVSLTDLLSREVRQTVSATGNTTTLSVKKLPRGTYALSLQSKNGRTFSRIIILK